MAGGQTRGTARGGLTRSAWFWLLMVAPGRLVTLESARPAAEVAAALRTAPRAQVLHDREATFQIPGFERELHLWIESAGAGTRLIGQMRTPYRAALTRLLITLLLFGLCLVLAFMARFWFSLFFFVFSVLFLLLSQYERVLGRDLRRHVAWLTQHTDARLIRPPRR